MVSSIFWMFTLKIGEDYLVDEPICQIGFQPPTMSMYILELNFLFRQFLLRISCLSCQVFVHVSFTCWTHSLDYLTTAIFFIWFWYHQLAVEKTWSLPLHPGFHVFFCFNFFLFPSWFFFIFYPFLLETSEAYLQRLGNQAQGMDTSTGTF